MRTSRDQGALDAPILSQSRKAQSCISLWQMRPDPPLDTTGRDLSSAPMSAGTALMTTEQRRTCCLVRCPQIHSETKKARARGPGLPRRTNANI